MVSCTPGQKRAPTADDYFVTKLPGLSESVRDAGDDVAVIETKRSGASEAEYEPKPVNRNLVSLIKTEWIPSVFNRIESNGKQKTGWN